MSDLCTRRIWKVRTVKNYADAHNHIFIGRVMEVTDSYIRMNCRTFHFGKSINNPRDIRTGMENVRVIPWSRVEVINELSSDFDFNIADLTADKDGKIVLKDKKLSVVISSYDRRY